ncbi:MAG: isopentenyl-diphosphate delta-isomerase [Bacteroidetes bacterium]|nr:isopentenyl-diphosphate delta-isomerase [Bacteroidota bacterium]
MKFDPTQAMQQDDPTAVSRKQDHIELAFASRVDAQLLNQRFYYEPLLSAHPNPAAEKSIPFLKKTLKVPLWVSSMTGGTEKAATINKNLARACGEFGMGMGLGSCRQLLNSDEYLSDFSVRKWMGYDVPLYANLGIAQIETLIQNRETAKIRKMLDLLEADGLIVHVNPMQEALQPEGDVFTRSPLQTIESLLQIADYPIVVKEVGQGMGPQSIRALLQLPLAALEFAAAGGTNFAKLELLRNKEVEQNIFAPLAAVGHTAAEMLAFVNKAVVELGPKCKVNQLIISGGLHDFLDGYYLIKKSNLLAIFGQASGFLKYAQGDYETLRHFVQLQIRGLALAEAYLTVK